MVRGSDLEPQSFVISLLCLSFLQAQLRLYRECWAGAPWIKEGQGWAALPRLWVPQIAFLGWDDKLHPKDPKAAGISRSLFLLFLSTL